ncbi:heparanase-like protein 3 [Cinnamomum micranthum f. kanehirae]|uniref:Heparanase-like protein 3 n=1 Tax=Cinnamomum micranthum f. kanehirae TaxID=337451 RepID=A0A3S3PI08_9MAGN|nr:heparanase-like protein 3 [Cinnamomum micranthum f. kanehirae]
MSFFYQGLCLLVSVLVWSSVGVLCQSPGNTTSSFKSGVVQGYVHINGGIAIGRIDSDFICATLDWWPPEKCDYGTCSWGLASLLNLDLNNPIFINAVKAFSPLKIRLGGTLQDKVIYDTGDPPQPCNSFKRNTSEMFGFTQGCLPMFRWDELNGFFQKTNAKVIFGLNALNGRVPLPDGSLGGPWDYTNAASLIRYTVSKGYTIHGWELGNELSGNGVGARVGADQYAADVISLHSIVNDNYRAIEVKPLILAPGGFFDANWFKELIDRTSPNSMDVITHHIYNLGPGVDDHLVEKILNPDYLDGEASTFSSLQNILKTSPTSATAWVGEAGGAYNSGHNLVTNAFVFSFWYLDQLGMASKYDTKTYCRQSLVGGNYGLLNTTTFKPNPDYYSALLWHRLMGRNVLSTNFTGTKNMRAYAHCAKRSEGITLLLINLDSNTTVQVHVTTDSAINKVSKHRRHPRKKPDWMHRPKKTIAISREEYHLTAMNGDLHSQTMLLNGKALIVNSTGESPPLEPMKVDTSEPITVTPFSIVFVHIPNIHLSACR